MYSGISTDRTRSNEPAIMSSSLAFEDVLKFSLGIACLSFSAMGEGAGLLIGFILYKLFVANKGEALRQKRP